MKTIIIAGEHSYIGDRFQKWLARTPEDYQIRTVSLRTDAWREADFSGCDALFHVAGIAHQKETAENAPLYYAVNRDLAYLVAKKAKAEGVKQFIFLSSMSVYGRASGQIDSATVPMPNTHYGRSKLAAEALLTTLACERFVVSILRPPLVFGPGCKGNYPRLSAMARRLPLFPACANARSMVFVDHLCEAVRRVIEARTPGLFFPQEARYVDTGKLMVQIARAHGKRLWLVHGFSWAVKALSRCGGTWEKVLGSLTYDQKMSDAPAGYRLFTLEEAIDQTEMEGWPG
ncbi:MAG: NAD-dependent epimerase/dehydratase family protein [Clostridia bacterium]